MGHPIQRFGFRVGRGWMILLLIAAGLVGASYWIGPLRTYPAELELLAVAGDTAAREITVAGTRLEDGTVRFSVPVAMRNVGAQPGRPDRLALSVPAYFRVATPRGVLHGEATAGVPLRRYEVRVGGAAVLPDPATRRVPGLDTLYLESNLATYYCTLQSGVPDFLPAPRHNPATLATVRIFYSFGVRDVNARNTGVLTVHVDSSLLQSTPAPMPPSFRTEFEEPEAQAPELGAIVKDGTRTAYCGDPEQPVELFTTRWRTPGGGLFYVVYADGSPRKHLYDLNADDIIDLEMWDANGDGTFDARRAARFRVPEFLVPQRERIDERLLPDSVRPDSVWLARFRDVRAGPWRFSERALRATADSIERIRTATLDSARAVVDNLRDAERMRMVADSVRNAGAVAPATAATGIRARVTPADTAGVRPAEPRWLRLFLDTSAGPFRFSRPPADTAEPAPPPTENPRPRRRQGPLGTPVPYPRPDTLLR